jgi:adenylate cyclase
MRAAGRAVSFAHLDAPCPQNGADEDRRVEARVVPNEAPRTFATRLLAVLAADVADYSRHMAEDEAGTYRRCTALWRDVVQPVVARWDGQTVKNTGDGFLAVFVSATSAVRSAVEFQRAVYVWNRRRARGRELLFRVGVNLGDVIVEPHDVFGHTVNVAARLEAMAEPGSVLVSHAVSASVRDGGLSFEDVGELSLKNIRGTVRGFRVQASLSKGGSSRTDRAPRGPAHVT